MERRTSNCRDARAQALITVDRADRDLLHAELIARLDELREIPAAIRRGDFEEARRQRCRFERATRLLDDLGWNALDAGEQFALTMDVDTLTQIISDIGTRALRRLKTPRSTYEAAEHNLRLLAACCGLIDQLREARGAVASARRPGP